MGAIPWGFESPLRHVCALRARAGAVPYGHRRVRCPSGDRRVGGPSGDRRVRRRSGERDGAGKEGVAYALPADRGSRSVSRVNHRFVRQHHQLPFDALEQRGSITAGQIQIQFCSSRGLGIAVKSPAGDGMGIRNAGWIGVRTTASAEL